MKEDYTLYILHCRDGSLYAGITNHLDQRLRTHAEGKGSKYVRSRLPFQLIYTETYATKSDALQREATIKRWARQKKIKELGLSLPPANNK